MNGLFQDVRYALRQLRKNPGFAVVAVFTLALGSGVNTAIFSVINSALLQPLPYPDAKQLVQLFETLPAFDRNPVSGGAFKDWQSQSSKFARLAIYEEIRRNLTGVGTPENVQGLAVSSEFLSVLGVNPIVGRDFIPGEDSIGGNNHVILLTHKFWLTRFSGDSRVVGRTVSLNQVLYTIVGVLPANALLQDDALFLVPDVIDAPGANWTRGGHWRLVIGRLLPGVTAIAAQTELRGIRQRLASEYPAFKKDWSVAVVPMQQVYTENSRQALMILLGTVGLVLLIACVNVSNLLLARGNARSKEMAVRAALGAHAARLVRQMLVESLLLALLGCAVGAIAAVFAVKILTNMTTGMVPLVLQPKLNAQVFLVSLLVACGCGILFGILPAWRASRSALSPNLKETSLGTTSRAKKRSQSSLLVAEFAFTLILLAGAGLFLRSFVRILGNNPGFRPEQTLAFDLSFPDVKYPKGEDRFRFVQGVTQQLAVLPGIESAASSSALPLGEGGTTEFASRSDQPERTDYIVSCNFISPQYFSALGMTLLRGRSISEADNQGKAARVLVVDESLAHDLYPGRDPIGQRLNFLGESWEIIGIVPPVHQFFLDSAPRPTVYGPQSYAMSTSSVVIRSALPPSFLAQAVRKTVLEMDPDQPVANVRTLEEAVHKSLTPRRSVLILMSTFAAIATLLACIGIYGVVSYAVGQQARELSIRSALGAQRVDIVKLVLKGGMKPSILGILIGLPVALALARLFANQLFAIQAHDPLVFSASVGVLALVAVISAYIPAHRAAKADPIVALRYE